MVALSSLDRDRFGVVTAREPCFDAAGLPSTLGFCAARRVELLVARCAAEDLRAAQAMEDAGGRLMDVLVYWQRPLDTPLPPAREPAHPGLDIRPLRPGDETGVRDVAARSFRNYLGHYHADPRLDRAACDEVYASWAERSCADPAVATAVWVAALDGRVCGFLTCLDRDDGEREIVLNGVDPSLQRHGVYRALVIAALEGARDAGARRMTVSTQLVNVGVQKSWARLGFEPWRSFCTFHLWRDERASRPPEGGAGSVTANGREGRS